MEFCQEMEAENHFLHSCRNPLRKHMPAELWELVDAGVLIFQRANWEDEMTKMEEMTSVQRKNYDTAVVGSASSGRPTPFWTVWSSVLEWQILLMHKLINC